MKRILSALVFAATLCAAPAAFAAQVGEEAPDFTATAVDGSSVKLSDLKGKIVVLEWFNEGCPFVQKHYNAKAMQKIQANATGKGIVWLTINSTGKEHRDYLDEAKTKALISKWDIKSSHFILDSEGKIGKMYAAKTTPHMFIIGKDGKLVYQGAIDDDSSPTGDPAKATNYVSTRLDQMSGGLSVAATETKPYGCSVKYAI